MPKEPEGAAPAVVYDHAFVPLHRWFQRCQICGLGEAAHKTTTVPREART